MFLTFVYGAAFLQGICVIGSYAAIGLIDRGNCFNHDQENCNEDFIDVYKNMSKSVEGTDAESYFLLYTRKNKENPEKLHKCAGRLPPNSNYNPNNRIIMLIPAYLSEWCDLHVYRDWKDEILKKEDANVIGIDYCWEAMTYDSARKNIKIAAKQIITVLKNIQEQTAVENLDVTIVGISLGAQLSSQIGKDFKIQSIIGLDPAGPGFDESLPLDERLDPSDARYVQVMHCNAGIPRLYLGVNYDCGHKDFWINGGSIQDSCHSSSVESFSKLDIMFGVATLSGPSACYHVQCAHYFKASINDCTFIGIKCQNYDDFLAGKCRNCESDFKECAVFGLDSENYLKEIPKDSQRYYLKTTLIYSYCDNSFMNNNETSKNNKRIPRRKCKKSQKN